MAIADRPEALRHGREREVGGVCCVHLVPRERRRYARVRGRPHRIGRSDGAVLGVLVVIDEHAVALFLPPLAGGELRGAPLDLARQRQRRPAHFAETPAPLDAHQHVQTAAPRGLGPPGEPEVPQRGADDLRHLAHLHPLDAGNGIEVDSQLVGMVQIFGANGMRVQLEAGEIGEPGERGGVTRHDLVGGPARREPERDDLDPRGPGFGRALLVEGLRRDPIGVADQHVGTPARATQRAIGNGEVIAHEVEFRVLRLGEEYLARVRDRDLASGDYEQLGFTVALPGLRAA